MKPAYDIQQVVTEMALAVQLRVQDRLQEALACIDGILDKIPRFPPCLLERANLLSALARYEEALAACNTYLEYAPPTPETAGLRDGIAATAIGVYRDALAIDPADIAARLHCGNIYLQTDRPECAVHEYTQLLEHSPAHRDALVNLGFALVALGREPEALVVYNRLLTHGPDDADMRYNRGNVAKNLGLMDAAMTDYRHATARRPAFAEAWLEQAHCLLMQGDLRQGWPLLEWRWKTAQLAATYLATTAPVWLGGALPVTPDRPCTLLVWAEQGLGDTLQFVRFVPLLADRGIHVVLRAPAALCTLLRTLDARVAVIANALPLPPHDCHIPLMSLPLALGLDQVPPTGAPYLAARDGTALSAWQTYLQHDGAAPYRIGVAWAGRQAGVLNATRDVPLAALLPLLSPLLTRSADLAPDIEIISLMQQTPAGDAGALARLAAHEGWRQPGALLTDFSQTAALVAQLDLVIGVDSAIAHLAGALGKPCWLLLRHSSEWRWGLSGAASPWYPSITVFRQGAAGRWQDPVLAVLARIMAQLPQIP